MDKKFGVYFLKASIIYFCISVTMGAIMTLIPVYNFVMLSILFARAHAHLSLIGWVSMSIIGFMYMSLGYLNKPMYSERLGYVGFSLLNIGLIAEFATLTVGGYVQSSSYVMGHTDAYTDSDPFTTFTVIFAFVMAVGVYATMYNIYRTLNVK